MFDKTLSYSSLDTDYYGIFIEQEVYRGMRNGKEVILQMFFIHDINRSNLEFFSSGYYNTKNKEYQAKCPDNEDIDRYIDNCIYKSLGI